MATCTESGLQRHLRRRLLRCVRCSGTAGTGGTASASGPSSGPTGSATQTRRPSERGTSRTSSNRLATAPIGSGRVPTGSTPTRRINRGSGRARGAGLGMGLTTVPSAPVADPRSAVMAVAEVTEEKRFCPAATRPSGARARGSRADRGVLPQVRHAVLVRAQAEAPATWSAGSTRWSAASPTAGSAGSTSPATATSPTAGSCSRACSTPATPTPWRPRSPSGSSSPRWSTRTSSRSTTSSSHRRRRLHRDGVRRRHVAQADPAQGSEQANGGAFDAVPVDRRSPTSSRSCPAFGYLHAQGLLYCDFKPDNVIQIGRRASSSSTSVACAGSTTTSRAIYGTVGYQAPEIAPTGPTVCQRHLHRRPHARGAHRRVPRLPDDVRDRCPPPTTYPVLPALRLALPLAGAGHRAPTPTTGSSPPTSCATSCSACSARSSPSTAASAAAAHSTSSSLFGRADRSPVARSRGRDLPAPAGRPPIHGHLARRRVARRSAGAPARRSSRRPSRRSRSTGQGAAAIDAGDARSAATRS